MRSRTVSWTSRSSATDLEAVLKRVVDESGIGADHDVRIDSQPLVVGVDALRVEQVLGGLLRFCGDRTATGKAITVRSGPMEGGALISVEDPEPSSDGSLSPVITRFVEMQGGWTKIENRDGGGSAFRVFLPDGGPSGQRRARLRRTMRPARRSRPRRARCRSWWPSRSRRRAPTPGPARRSSSSCRSFTGCTPKTEPAHARG